MFYKLLFFKLFFGCIVFNGIGQSTKPENHYDGILNNTSYFLYTGKLFYNDSKINATPFLESEPNEVDIYYSGIPYKNVLSFFNISTNEFVVKNQNGNLITLENYRIDSVIFGDRIFKPLAINNDKRRFFEVYDWSSMMLLVDHKKIIEEKILDSKVSYQYTDDTKCYLVKGDSTIVIRSINNLFKIFSVKKKKLKSFYKENNKFKDISRFESYRKVIDYFNSL